MNLLIRCCYFYLVLCLLPLSGMAQTNLRNSLSELRTLLAKQKDAENRAVYQIKLSRFYLYNKSDTKKNLDSAHFFALAATEASKSNHITAVNKESRTVLAEVLLRKGATKAALAMTSGMDELTKARMLINAGSYFLYKRAEHKDDLDTTFNFLLQAKKIAGSKKAVKLVHEAELYLCDRYEESGQHRKSEQHFAQLLKDCESSGDDEFAAATASRIGDHLPPGSEKIRFYELALKYYKKIGRTEQEIGMAKGIADVNLNLGKLKLAEQQLLSVLKRYQQLGYKNLQFTYDLLSAINQFSGSQKAALSYAISAIDYMELTESDASAGYFYSNLARIYGELGSTQQSINYFHKAVNRTDPRESDAKITAVKNLADQLILQGKISEVFQVLDSNIRKVEVTELGKMIIAGIKGKCYEALKKNAVAEAHFLDMIHWEKKITGRPFHSAESFYTIGSFYMHIKSFVKARTYFNKIALLPAGTYPLSKIKNVYLSLYQLDSATNKLDSAIVHYKLYKSISDSLLNASANRTISELALRYQSKQQEKDNQLLRKESILQLGKLQKADLTNKITLAGVAALLLIMVLIYRNYYHRKKANQQLVAQQQIITNKNHSLELLLASQEKLLHEKEWLIKEIHHRIKNNLQVVASLLNSQLNYLDNEEARLAIKDSQNRIQSISLIHQKLFQSEDLNIVDIHAYIHDLIKFLCDTFHVGQRINFIIDIPKISFDITQATPLGLIINEAITNIIKYAFPDDRPGETQISLTKGQNEKYVFRIKDNGTGLPKDLDQGKTMGMTLIRGLAEQLGGTADIVSDHGLSIRIEFELTVTER
jgi:two-component sensor histidine kinase